MEPLTPNQIDTVFEKKKFTTWQKEESIAIRKDFALLGKKLLTFVGSKTSRDIKDAIDHLDIAMHKTFAAAGRDWQ